MLKPLYYVKDMEDYYYRLIGEGFTSEIDRTLRRNIKQLFAYLYDAERALYIADRVNHKPGNSCVHIYRYEDNHEEDIRFLASMQRKKCQRRYQGLHFWEAEEREPFDPYKKQNEINI